MDPPGVRLKPLAKQQSNKALVAIQTNLSHLWNDLWVLPHVYCSLLTPKHSCVSRKLQTTREWQPSRECDVWYHKFTNCSRSSKVLFSSASIQHILELFAINCRPVVFGQSTAASTASPLQLLPAGPLLYRSKEFSSTSLFHPLTYEYLLFVPNW
jgi:hypothetical protein